MVIKVIDALIFEVPMTTDSNSYKEFFPYPAPRKGQSEMMQAIEEAVRTGVNICSEAPNGFGKTCVTLSSVLPWIKENDGKILYCARTHRQLDRVVEELVEISKRQDVSGVSFRGRRHMCLNPFVIENADFVAPISEVCGQLKATGRCSYYEKLKKAGEPEDLIEDIESKVLTAPEIVKIAKSKSMCPYEMAKRLAKVVDVVALSYLYVFDPWILEVFVPELGTPLSKIVLVQDEAHNVPATALDSASDSLTIRITRQATREASSGPFKDGTSFEFCRSLTKKLQELSADLKENSEKIVNPLDVVDMAIKSASLDSSDRVLHHMRDHGSKIKKGLLKAGKFPRSAIHRVAEFLINWQKCADKDNFAFILSSATTRGGTKRVSLDLAALDPTSVTAPVLSRIHNSVAISGTISPLDAYSEMLGFDSEAIQATFQSPFAIANRLGLIVSGLDTSFQNRNSTTFERMVDHCLAVVNATPGNTGIFASSYSITRSLIEAGFEKRLKRELFVERPGMKGTDNDKMIEEFKRKGERGGAVLLGVQGGRNSEGGDFPGSTMDSVVVVGVPYARPTPSMEALISYYDSAFNQKGRDYAYVLPAMTRSIQAAGRPVRRLDDRGAIVMLDQRFATKYLSRFIPSWLQEVMQIVPDNPGIIAHQVESFFMT
ncbi:MAG: helicase C-terminal domain-containing protein [Candidatus Thorarchaeota archaeon]